MNTRFIGALAMYNDAMKGMDRLQSTRGLQYGEKTRLYEMYENMIENARHSLEECIADAIPCPVQRDAICTALFPEYGRTPYNGDMRRGLQAILGALSTGAFVLVGKEDGSEQH